MLPIEIAFKEALKKLFETMDMRALPGMLSEVLREYGHTKDISRETLNRWLRITDDSNNATFPGILELLALLPLFERRLEVVPENGIPKPIFDSVHDEMEPPQGLLNSLTDIERKPPEFASSLHDFLFSDFRSPQSALRHPEIENRIKAEYFDHRTHSPDIYVFDLSPFSGSPAMSEFQFTSSVRESIKSITAALPKGHIGIAHGRSMANIFFSMRRSELSP